MFSRGPIRNPAFGCHALTAARGRRSRGTLRPPRGEHAGDLRPCEAGVRNPPCSPACVPLRGALRRESMPPNAVSSRSGFVAASSCARRRSDGAAGRRRVPGGGDRSGGRRARRQGRRGRPFRSARDSARDSIGGATPQRPPSAASTTKLRSPNRRRKGSGATARTCPRGRSRIASAGGRCDAVSASAKPGRRRNRWRSAAAPAGVRVRSERPAGGRRPRPAAGPPAAGSTTPREPIAAAPGPAAAGAGGRNKSGAGADLRRREPGGPRRAGPAGPVPPVRLRGVPPGARPRPRGGTEPVSRPAVTANQAPPKLTAFGGMLSPRRGGRRSRGNRCPPRGEHGARLATVRDLEEKARNPPCSPACASLRRESMPHRPGTSPARATTPGRVRPA